MKEKILENISDGQGGFYKLDPAVETKSKEEIKGDFILW